jgi:hypothetical protein
MITSLGSQWTIADLTGNGQFAQLGGSIYVVSNTLLNNTFKVFKSTDSGGSFSIVATHTFDSSSNYSFDPAIYVSGTDIHIIGTEKDSADTNRINLQKFTFDTTTDTLGSPTTILTGAKVHSGYDLLVTGDGKIHIVTSVTDLVSPTISGYSTSAGDSGYGFFEFILNSNNSFSSAVTLETSSIRSGNAHGGISLVLLNSTDFELFYTVHQKKVTFATIPQAIYLRTKTSGTWSSAASVVQYSGMYLDDKLTVLPTTGSDRVLAHLYYKQKKTTLIPVLTVGCRTSSIWNFQDYEINATEPTLSIDVAGNVRLAYLQGTPPNRNLIVSDVSLPSLKLTPRVGHFTTLKMNWARGTKTTVDNTSKWMIVGERYDSITHLYDPIFVSEYNLPPVAILTPLSGTIHRGTPFRLDASGSYDPDLDPIQYSWSQDDVSLLVQLVPIPGHPELIDLLVPKAIGPTARTIHVEVSLVDLDVTNTPIHSPVTATATLTVPFNNAPAISWPSNPLSVGRNQVITMNPTVTDAESDPLVYEWAQLSGTPLEIVGITTVKNLIFRTHGANILGETVQFQLTVSDQINTPVSSTINVQIASVNVSLLDNKWLSRITTNLVEI